VGSGTQVTGYPTNQELGNIASEALPNLEGYSLLRSMQGIAIAANFGANCLVNWANFKSTVQHRGERNYGAGE